MNQNKNFFVKFRAAMECSTYADRAQTFSNNRFSESENQEVITAAIIIAQAIRESSHDLERSIDALTSELENLNSTIDNKDTGAIESTLDELVKAVDNVAYHQ